ncbi:protein kinase domain-containing protein [Haematococcus lacustris]|uniref:Protein kinase domain-containing protein n=2 Tax=Haematococcus lacustris TaxID=44745 RepID=A0A699Z4J4_HAELA|nr:protein kinase domain-containing protein [Haematococcus lacustris]
MGGVATSARALSYSCSCSCEVKAEMGIIKKLKKLFQTSGSDEGSFSSVALPGTEDKTVTPSPAATLSTDHRPLEGTRSLNSTVESPAQNTGPSASEPLIQPGSSLPVSNSFARPSQHSENSSIASLRLGKLKNMVFVEAPANIELESDGHSLPHLASRSNTAYTPRSSQTGSTLGDKSSGGNTTEAVPQQAKATKQPQQQQVYRRVVRHASVPLLIDTSMSVQQGAVSGAAAHQSLLPCCPGGASPAQPQLPSPAIPANTTAATTSEAVRRAQEHQDRLQAAYKAKLEAQQAAANALPASKLYVSHRDGASSGPAALVSQSRSQAPTSSRQVLKPRPSPPRHASLKHLLKLDKYDFVSDANVEEAHHMMEAGSRADMAMHVSPRALTLWTPADPPGARGWSAALPSQRTTLASNILAVSPAVPPAMRRPMWSVADFKLSKKLHQGYASDVYFARCRRTLELVVLKVYRLADQCDLQRVQLYREIRVHSRLQHQNIVQFYAAFLEANCVIIVQEYAAEGDLLRYMYKTGGRLTERQAVGLVLQPFLSALLYLHTQLKLADFGLAVDLNEERANTRAGTLLTSTPLPSTTLQTSSTLRHSRAPSLLATLVHNDLGIHTP